MKIIKSKENKIYKSSKELLQKKHRERRSLYLAEGENFVEEGIKQGFIKQIILREDCRDKVYVDNENVESYVFDKKLFSSISQTESSQGIIGILEISKKNKESFIKSMKEIKDNIIVLDEVQDPGNVGTIIRTAEAAGYGGVLVIKGSADIYSSKVVRAAAGSIMRVPICYADSQSEAIDILKKIGKKIVGTSLEGKNFFYKEDISKECAIVIGNEGNGLSKEMLEAAHLNIKIPMKGKIESLNVAVATGILMYESMRKG